MKRQGKTTASAIPGVPEMLESVLGCKWSLRVLALVRSGVRRPGAMCRSVNGLSTKVLNERLRKLCRYGVLERVMYAEVPPRVEYRLTHFGKKLSSILDRIDVLDRERGAVMSAAVPTRGKVVRRAGRAGDLERPREGGGSADFKAARAPV